MANLEAKIERVSAQSDAMYAEQLRIHNAIENLSKLIRNGGGLLSQTAVLTERVDSIEEEMNDFKDNAHKKIQSRIAIGAMIGSFFGAFITFIVAFFKE